MKLITAFGGEWLEKLTLGSRGYQPTSDLASFSDEIVRAVLPMPIMRLWDTLNVRDKDTMFASSWQTAVKYAAAGGILDRRGDEEPGAFEKRVKSVLTNMSFTVLATRWLFGFVVPASPSALSGDGLSADARKMGIKGLRPEYLALLEKHNGNTDEANVEFYRLTQGTGMPYIVSATANTTPGYPSLTSESGKWLAKNGDFIAKHYDAVPFLTPSQGDYSFTTFALAKSLGFIAGRSNEDAFLLAITANDYYKYLQVKDVVDAQIAATEPWDTAGRNRIREQWRAAQGRMFTDNPYLKDRVDPRSSVTSENAKAQALESVRNAIGEIYAERPDMVTDSTTTIKNMLTLFDYGMLQVGKFTSKSDYDVDQRGAARAKLRVGLERLAGDDVNATSFYDRILSSVIG
jgi:hypothetical protein